MAVCSPCSATYADVEKMICQLCWKRAKLWKMDFDELKSVANESFMHAYQSWDGSRSSFVTHVYNSVSFGLLDHRIREAKYASRFKTGLTTCDDREQAADLSSVPDRMPRPILNLLDSLSDDARTIVQLIIDLPEDLIFIARCRSKAKIRRSLWNYLRGRGWSLSRTAMAFSEIREELLPPQNR